MVAHLFGIGALIIVVLACMFLPFLPGRYDGLAVTLSIMSQLFGAVGLLLVPIGAVWLVYELRKPRNREGSSGDKGYYFAIASLIALSLVAAIVLLGAVISLGFSLGILVLALWTYGVSRMSSRVKLLKSTEIGAFNPAPLYLLLVPMIVAIFQFSLVGPAIEFSRGCAIENSDVLIREIEKYHVRNGRYPATLLALHADYHPSVIGIEKFHYMPNGDAYNLYFEQLSNVFGTREVVMYNKLGEHLMPGHAKDILWWTEEQLRTRRGYYAVHEASSPHWKYFWFD